MGASSRFVRRACSARAFLAWERRRENNMTRRVAVRCGAVRAQSKAFAMGRISWNACQSYSHRSPGLSLEQCRYSFMENKIWDELLCDFACLVDDKICQYNDMESCIHIVGRMKRFLQSRGRKQVQKLGEVGRKTFSFKGISLSTTPANGLNYCHLSQHGS
ncbi:uncharacterized protein LOC118477301 [Aplysia californica]|uniref:Uncharacterized protein LOC118477301 n=1 Tax=Aplysia californica TaxID=6500 RepID=A0ABM1VPJ0_APLCA|nr:uncharacterized protein LOC118477301 [Aplysia californica]